MQAVKMSEVKMPEASRKKKKKKKKKKKYYR